jgi:hypothetical protein
MRRLLLPLLLLLAACGAYGDPAPDNPFGEPPPPDAPQNVDRLCNVPGSTRCSGFDFEICVEGRWIAQQTCASPTPVCDPDAGCTGCAPETRWCSNQEVWACDESGTTGAFVETCSGTEECLVGQCFDACTLAEGTNSYLGCRFLSVSMANLVEPVFWDDFAVVVGNPSTRQEAEVTISRDGDFVASAVIDPRSTEAIELPMVAELQAFTEGTIVRGGAYEVRSTIPVAAYQYNPLHFSLEVDGDDVFSFTNDASLLLPEHVLTGNYRAAAWPGLGVGNFPGSSSFLPGTVAIAATTDGTLVEITSSAETAGGEPGALQPGDTTVLALNRGDVLQIQSAQPPEDLGSNLCEDREGLQDGNGSNDSCLDVTLGDLSGTVISASQPIAAWGGHVCTFIPHSARACDHLEEMLFPLETWGTQTVIAAPMYPGRDDASTASVIRVLSAVDGNTIRFTPPALPDTVLNAGESVEIQTPQDVLIEGDGPFLATQLLLGQQALFSNIGDPAMGTGSPLQQWRTEYDFLAPDTYEANWLGITAPAGTQVFLDGVEVDGWVPVEGTPYEVARVEVDSGSHRVQSIGEVGFGIVSYGYARFTSYLHPGGMNFLR